MGLTIPAPKFIDHEGKRYVLCDYHSGIIKSLIQDISYRDKKILELRKAWKQFEEEMDYLLPDED